MTPDEEAATAEPGPRARWTQAAQIAKRTVIEWLESEVPSRGAALAYYVLLSLGPFLVLVVGALEFFLSGAEVRTRIVEVVRDNLGPRASETAQTVLQRVEVPDFLAPESVLTMLLLAFAATGVFANVRGSLNSIWGIGPDTASKREIALDLLRARLRGGLMILLTGLVIAVSFAVTSAAGLLADAIRGALRTSWLWVRGIDFAVSVVLTGLLFGAIFRTLPARRIEWRTIWVGAFTTALIFVIGKSLVAGLIASASWTSYYGPGASVVAFLAWIYLSAQLFFLGAVFTKVWSQHTGGVMSREQSNGVAPQSSGAPAADDEGS